ncbi:Acyltransferase family protein [Clostridium vincentii]|uniref:Acyltransferase family protein n=1 Tax=Clostridium vincentii TaxID=52704 RepID=A0A2T0BCX5_9CLOT|nr:acyltransferase family protein [Clostridium vincentii]PRR81749.1 Acyltransferase family protein [Clostridium vincentii]
MIIRKIQTIVVPILFWALLTKVLMVIFNGEAFTVKSFILQVLSSLWFLWAVFYSSIGLIIGNKLFKDNILFHVVVVLGLMLLPNMLSKDLYGFMYPYFAIGYYANKHKIDIKSYNIKIISATYIIMMLFWDKNKYIYTTGLSFYNSKNVFNTIGIDIYRWVIGLLGSIIVIWVVGIIYDRYNSEKLDVIRNIGVESLGIYILNIYISNYLLVKINIFESLNEAIYTIICFIMSLIITIVSIQIINIIKKSKVLNRLSLGGR